MSCGYVLALTNEGASYAIAMLPNILRGKEVL